MKSTLYRVIGLRSLLVFLSAAALWGCSGSTGQETSHKFPVASLNEMPAVVQSAPVTVQEGYQFAAANPQVLQQLPCYCGCGSMGHTSNYACYISELDSAGKPTFDEHALGCSICVDITQDAMRLLDQDKSVAEIRTYIDQTYAQYGPSNMP